MSTTTVDHPGADQATTVTDIHGKMYPTSVHDIVRPGSVGDVVAAIARARAEGRGVSIAGGRHAMGGQQFGAGTLLLDMTGMDRVIEVDNVRGEVEAEAGILWPALIEAVHDANRGQPRQWGIRQKQTGADRLSLGGALSANVHGRGLAMAPIIGDVTSFTLVDADGRVRRCSRAENADLFRLAVGGYGLFGVITSARLRLAPREKVERVVEVVDVAGVIDAFAARVADGFTYGDFQFAIDPAGDDFLRRGVFSCYRPVPDDTPIPAGQRALSREDWATLLYLGHVDKRRAVDMYTAHYLATSGQIYWSDTHQLADYTDHYHVALDEKIGAETPASEIITEIYVPRAELPRLFAAVREDFRRHEVDLVYGTVRLIEQDDESFLAWAREPFACTIFNLHTVHSPEGIERSAAAFRRLIDLAIELRGSYYLTYHRCATAAQVEACHPRFREFLALKRHHDPDERFQSDWYRHYRDLFSDSDR